MKRWLLEFTLDAERDLAKLDCEIRRRIREFYKLRVGDWRVIYKINWEERIIIVCCVDRRDKIYKKRK